MVISKYIKGDISDDPNSPMWGQSPAAKFPLFSQVIFEPRWFDGRVKEITVRSLNNGERIAFLLEWEDKTENGEGEELMDGAALEFPVGKEKAYFAHAQRMELVSGGKVNIWHWKAGSPIKDMNAEGLGALTLQEHQDVAGKGVFSNGRWRVVFLRGLKSSDSKDTEFQPGEYKDIAFAIWDGANSEQGGQKTVSGWYYLQIEAPMSKMVYIYTVIAVIGAGLFEIFIIRRLRER